MITFKKFNKWFKGLHALKDVELHVDQGGAVVIRGTRFAGEVSGRVVFMDEALMS